MNTEDILKLNIDFYQSIAKDFDKTRQKGWEGWNSLIPYIRKLYKQKTLEQPSNTNQYKLRVADIACGNGRFFKFLQETEGDLQVDYYGFDVNEYLLERAKETISTGHLTKIDLIRNYEKVTGKYDLVTVFGFMHHVPTIELRINIIKHLTNILETNGLLILSFWQYNNLKQNSKLIAENSYIDNWAKSEHQRYVHIYSQEEIDAIISKIGGGIIIEESFEADGRSKNLNKYLLLRKVS
jgi:2-polyprenyl-3-methyl-5-hydroxy-6-metoxy-1,4-benzoquinol methylase